jgi:hypothetical protein
MEGGSHDGCGAGPREDESSTVTDKHARLTIAMTDNAVMDATNDPSFTDLLATLGCER